MSLLSDRVAVVTGSGAIGTAVADALKRHGARVTVWDISERALQDMSEQLHKRVVDVTSEEQLAAATDALIDAEGRIDVMVNTAAIFNHAPVQEMPTETWQQMMEVNLNGVFGCCRAVVPHMVNNGSGSIINISSVGGLRGSAGIAHYCASKFGVIGLSESLALEVGPYGVRVNCICPGAVDSAMNTATLDAVARRVGTSYESVERSIVERTALRRLVQPEDVASAAVFLASDLASGVTAVALPVTGGLV